MNRRGMQLQNALRPLRAGDIAGVCALVAASPAAAQWSSEAYAQLLEGPACAFVLSEELRVIGFIALLATADEAEILNLAVLPECRRQGYGSRLLAAAEQHVRSRGALSLFLEVRESNSPAIRFYENQGFVRTGLRPNYYRDPAEAAVLMARKITAFPG